MGQDKVKMVLGSGLIMAADVIAEQDATIAMLSASVLDLTRERDDRSAECARLTRELAAKVEMIEALKQEMTTGYREREARIYQLVTDSRRVYAAIGSAISATGVQPCALDAAVADVQELAASLADRTRERDEAREAREQLAEGIAFIVGKSQEMRDLYRLSSILAPTFDLIRDGEASNYVTSTVSLEVNGATALWSFTAQRVDGKTPADVLGDRERERDTALASLRTAEDRLERVATWLDGQCVVCVVEPGMPHAECPLDGWTRTT